LLGENFEIFTKIVFHTLVEKLKAGGEKKDEIFDDNGPFYKIKSSDNKIVEFEYIWPLLVSPTKFVFKIRMRDDKKYSVLKIGDVLEEIKTLEKLKDIKNVQQIIMIGKAMYDEDCFISPYYGETLDNYNGDISESSQIWKQIKKLICQIHKRGVVHLDMKPKNICVSQDGIVTLIDFNLAREIGECDESAPLGTLNFCSVNQMFCIMPPSKNDDFETLKYTKYYIINGTLPWINDSYPIVLKKKQEFLKKDFQNGFPKNEKNKENSSTKINQLPINDNALFETNFV